ncbi:MAG TPA: HAMP domain-containing sensor histidine kinase [candidate division Zixibacteria bacterium]|nr:HAMP domain-containing sensor histidine kinase [candidate division Zixibacteria bacterium]
MRRARRAPPGNTLIDAFVRRIRNPLNALLLHIDSLEDEISEVARDAVRERLEKMRDVITELDAFLCEVLRVIELPSSGITAIDLNALLKEVETFARPEATKKDLTVAVRVENGVPMVQGDPIQIKQAILNILLNAIESSRPGGAITLATESRENSVAIKIEDRGGGISPAERDRIFDAFFSTKEGRAGLGLTLAREIVRLHGGQIVVSSEVGKGASFIVSLPVKP